jgi:hypothetical protein
MPGPPLERALLSAGEPHRARQAWHWVDPVAGAASAARALRSGGRLAVFWNVFQPAPDVGEAFSAVYRPVLPDSIFSRGTDSVVQGYATFFTKAADGIRAVGAFSDPEQWRFDWERSYSRDEWLYQLPTFGGHSQFPPAKLHELLAGIGAAIDTVGGSFTMQYTAVVVTAARTEAPDGFSWPDSAGIATSTRVQTPGFRLQQAR